MTSAFELFRAGDAAAFDAVVREYTPYAYGVAVQVLGQPALAEEAVQEAFVRIWKQSARFDPARGPEKAWILAIVRNQAIDLVRKRDRHPERSIEDALGVYGIEDPGDVVQTVLANLTGERVRAAIAQLPEAQRETVVLAYYRGLRPVEIARQTGTAEGTIRSRLRLGLVRLRELLAPVREEVEP